jgi:hypothetical protein
MSMSTGILVHKRHCCHVHGCKYGDVNCPVEGGAVYQDGPCECCPGNHYFTVEITAEELYALRDITDRAQGYAHRLGTPLPHADELAHTLERLTDMADVYMRLDRHYAKMKEERDSGPQ